MDKKFINGFLFLVAAVLILLGIIAVFNIRHVDVQPNPLLNRVYYKSGEIVKTVIFLPIGIICLVAGTNLRKKMKDEIDNSIKCPFCANDIKKEATVCQFCHKDIPKQEGNETNLA